MGQSWRTVLSRLIFQFNRGVGHSQNISDQVDCLTNLNFSRPRLNPDLQGECSLLRVVKNVLRFAVAMCLAVLTDCKSVTDRWTDNTAMRDYCELTSRSVERVGKVISWHQQVAPHRTGQRTSTSWWYRWSPGRTSLVAAVHLSVTTAWWRSCRVGNLPHLQAPSPHLSTQHTTTNTCTATFCWKSNDHFFKSCILLLLLLPLQMSWITMLPSHSYGSTLQKSRFKTVAQLSADVCWPSE